LSSEGRRSDAEHGALELLSRAGRHGTGTRRGRRCEGTRATGRAGGRWGRTRSSGPGSTGARTWRLLIHHQHRPLELRGRSAF
jgi:hypothetical protein